MSIFVSAYFLRQIYYYVAKDKMYTFVVQDVHINKKMETY